jgi:cytochrome c553
MSRSPGRQPDVKHGAVIVTQGTAAGAAPRPVPRLQWRFRCQRRVSADRGPVGLLSCQGAARLCVGRQGECDYVADRQGAFARRHCGRLGVLLAHGCAFSAIQAPDTALVQRGEELAKVGDAARRIQSCDKCHGPGGVGEPPAIPYLAGQYAHYIALTLHMWQQGYRRSSPDGMAVMAKKLDEQETAAVAAYYQKVQVVPARTEEAVSAERWALSKHQRQPEEQPPVVEQKGSEQAPPQIQNKEETQSRWHKGRHHRPHRHHKQHHLY